MHAMTQAEDATSPRRADRTRGRLQRVSAHQELRAFRLWAGLLAAFSLISAAWLAPWTRIGMARSDYDAPTIIGFAMVITIASCVCLLVRRWGGLFSQEPMLEMLRALFGDSLSVRTGERFRRRLEFQCKQASRAGAQPFSVAVVQLPDLSRDEAECASQLEEALDTVRGVIRSHDVLGDSGSQELWVLLNGAAQYDSRVAVARIASALDGSDGSTIRTGTSTFEANGRDAPTLLRIARERASGTNPGSQAIRVDDVHRLGDERHLAAERRPA